MKLDAAVVRKIRKLQIQTRRIMQGMLMGESRSVIKGFGFDFDQIRPYQLGDDVRFIDWKATSRKNKLLVKQYFQEQNKTICIVIDISASQDYSSSEVLKSDLARQIGAVLALASQLHNDAVSLLLCTDTVELFIPPKKGNTHVQAIVEKLFTYKAKKKKTALKAALEYIGKLKKRNMIIFLISDFIDESYEKSLSLVARKHELVAVCCEDAREEKLPAIGFLTVEDPESSEQILIDLRNPQAINTYLNQRKKAHKIICNKYGIEQFYARVGYDFITDLIMFFNRRIKEQRSIQKQ